MLRQSDERGATAMVIAIVITAMVAAAALVVDVGLIYQERRQLQSSVDAAALAGAIDLAEERGQAVAENTARRYVLENANVPPEEVTVTFPESNQVRVRARTQPTFFFARIMGLRDAPVIAQATAAFGPASRVSNLVPILVPIQKVAAHTGVERTANFELGRDRPVESFSKQATVSGNSICYTITYVNRLSSAVNLTITDPLEAGLTYVEGSATSGGTYDPGTRTITWNTQVPPGANLAVHFWVSADNPANAGNTAYADDGSGAPQKATAGDEPQKGYFWLCDFNAGSGGVPEYDSWIRNGYPEEVRIGFVANGEGVKASLKQALEARMSSDPKVVLPLYDYTEGGGSPGRYHVVGFAEFVILGFDFTGSAKTLTGYFTTGTVTSGAGGPSPPGYAGVDCVWLTE